jgi:hypothetical protein
MRNVVKMKIQRAGWIALTGALVFISGCRKDLFEPDIEGTWIEINNTSSQNPTGCQLVIDKTSGEVTLCGFQFVHPANVVTITTQKKARLIVDHGQMFYRQKKADFLWMVPIGREDIYFIDYDFEGSFLWIIGDNSSAKASAKGAGKVFRKQ